MIKILHLQPQLNKTCGISRMIFTIIKSGSSDFEHFILTLGGDDIDSFKNENIKLKVCRIKKNKLIKSLKLLFSILIFCSKNKIQIIHSHHRYFDALAYLVSKLFNIRTIMTVHSKVFGKRSISYKSEKLIAVSKSIKEHLISNYNIPSEKIEVIYNFISKDNYHIVHPKPEILQKYCLINYDKIIGFVGRFDKEKGVDVLLKAFKIVQQNYKSVCLILVGEGREHDYYNEFIMENKLNVKLINPTKHIADFMNIFDILILPSRVDPFPVVMLEAGLFEKILIGSSVDGIKEFINDGKDGYLFHSENYIELSEKILFAIKNIETMESLAKNLNQKVLKNFSSQTGINSYEDIYRKVI